MLRIGLTGGIAAGKSVVASRLAELGAVLVDADVLARQAVEPGSEGLREVVTAFGGGVLTEDGSLDRPALGRLIFGDAAARERLNAIVHPRVRSSSAALIEAAGDIRSARSRGTDQEAMGEVVVVEDIPLLVETGQAARFHLVIVVDAPDAERVRRMVDHRGMDARDAELRIAAQVPGPERLKEADAVLTNTGTRDELIGATDALWHHRLMPFAGNLAAGRPSSFRNDTPTDHPAMALGGTVGLARRTRAKIEAALPEGCSASFEPLDGQQSDDVSSTGLRATVTGGPDDVLHREGDLIVEALTSAGFPRVSAEPAALHRGSDPATSIRLEVAGVDPRV